MQTFFKLVIPHLMRNPVPFVISCFRGDDEFLCHTYEPVSKKA